MTLAEALKTARENSGLNQTQLAEASGVSQQIISRIERGEGIGSVVSLRRLSRRLKTDLLEYVDPTPTQSPAPEPAPAGVAP